MSILSGGSRQVAGDDHGGQVERVGKGKAGAPMSVDMVRAGTGSSALLPVAAISHRPR